MSNLKTDHAARPLLTLSAFRCEMTTRIDIPGSADQNEFWRFSTDRWLTVNGYHYLRALTTGGCIIGRLVTLATRDIGALFGWSILCSEHTRKVMRQHRAHMSEKCIWTSKQVTSQLSDPGGTALEMQDTIATAASRCSAECCCKLLPAVAVPPVSA